MFKTMVKTCLIRYGSICLCLTWPWSIVFPQQLPEEHRVLYGTGTIRFVNNSVFANLIQGHFTITMHGFTFYPDHATWLLDSLYVPNNEIDMVTRGFGAILIHLQDRAKIRLQCSRHRLMVDEWQEIRHSDIPPKLPKVVPDARVFKHDALIRGNTFGSIICTPIRFKARITLDTKWFVIMPTEAPLSFIHARYKREQIKRIKIKHECIRVVLHEGGRFSLRAMGNVTLITAISDWFDQL